MIWFCPPLYRSIVFGLTPVTFLEDWDNRRFSPVIWDLALFYGSLEHFYESWRYLAYNLFSSLGGISSSTADLWSLSRLSSFSTKFLSLLSLRFCDMDCDQDRGVLRQSALGWTLSRSVCWGALSSLYCPFGLHLCHPSVVTRLSCLFAYWQCSPRIFLGWMLGPDTQCRSGTL